MHGARPTRHQVHSSGPWDDPFPRVVHDAGELTWAPAASVLVMPYVLINSQYLHACEPGGVIRCGLQARLDVGPHGVPRCCQLSSQSCNGGSLQSAHTQGTQQGNHRTLCRAPEHLWGASHAHQMEALQTDEQITPITTIKRRRAAAGKVRHCRGPLTTAGGRSPLIIKDLDLYPQPPTNTHSPTLNSEEPDSRYQLSAQLHVGGLLAPVGLSATIAAMGPSANHTTRTLIREELFNHTAYEVQIAVTFVPAATSFLRLSFPPVVTSTLCA